jgi:DNA-binding CsgD family transcriptional regulator
MVLARAAYVLALLADAEDDAQGVVNALGHLVIGRGAPARGALSRHDLYTRALVRLGRLDEAHCHLAAMTAAANGQHANSVALAHSRAAIASASGDTDSANAAFDEAASLATATGGPFVAAQVGLDYGGFLRRRGRRRVAATRLEAARAGFESLGATTYVARCDRELGATGLGRRPSQPARATGLTPAEQAVANLIMQGASNRDAARTLVLSVRTIETHLGRIYRKLGVTSRAQLVGRIAGRDAGEVS